MKLPGRLSEATCDIAGTGLRSTGCASGRTLVVSITISFSSVCTGRSLRLYALTPHSPATLGIPFRHSVFHRIFTEFSERPGNCYVSSPS